MPHVVGLWHRYGIAATMPCAFASQPT